MELRPRYPASVQQGPVDLIFRWFLFLAELGRKMVQAKEGLGYSCGAVGS